MTGRRDIGNGPRVFQLDDLDGFYLDDENDRCYHFTLESTRLVIDIFDTLEAAYEPVGDIIDSIAIDLKSGKRVDN